MKFDICQPLFCVMIAVLMSEYHKIVEVAFLICVRRERATSYLRFMQLIIQYGLVGKGFHIFLEYTC